jgi:ribosome-interacting GTPase 1
MPTNLPPDYFEVEKEFRQATDPAEKISLLEEMYSLVPKHKGTDHLRADLRRQLSRLKNESQKSKKKAGHTTEYHIPKEGAGQVVLIGTANVGKSSILKTLTNAEPEISPAPFTTWKPQPGMMPYEDVQIQLVDTPPLDPVTTEGALFGLLRQADLLVLVVDLQTDPLGQIEEALSLLKENRIVPLEMQDEPENISRIAYKPFLLLVNQYDDDSLDEDYEVCCGLMEIPLEHMPVSALTGRNLEVFKRVVYARLGVIRVYAKPPGEEADLQRPFVLKHGSTVIELAAKVHRDFFENLKYARVWGSSIFEGQMVNREYVLQDGDIVELKI